MPRLEAPDTGVTIRMYRQGHGDCFLLCTRGDDGKPVYLVIDCGLWGGSKCDPGPVIAEVVADIAESTGGRLDLLVITHEHRDHVSGFLAKDGQDDLAWNAIKDIDELWLAWTEDEKDEKANELREAFDDVLLGLAAVASRPQDFGFDAKKKERSLTLIRDILDLHTGEDDPDALFRELGRKRKAFGVGDGDALAAAPGMSNKRAIKEMRGKARRLRFLAPERGPTEVPRASGLRAFALGPPRDVGLLRSLDPRPGEGFGLDDETRLFLDAVDKHSCNAEDGEEPKGGPFGRRHGTPPQKLKGEVLRFYNDHYIAESWRRIDGDWSEAAEALALRIHTEVNNTSLVLAFELPRTRMVLLFTGDAQRGSWISWAPLQWGEGEGRVTARDLLGRVVLYKVGHHGSHNATLKGSMEDPHPNLGWLGLGEASDEFVAFIPANRPWAENKKKWKHPLEDIEAALLDKAGGRVFRMDATAPPERPGYTTEAKWAPFRARTNVNNLYAQYTVPD